MSDLKVLETSEEATETCYTLKLEHEAELYTVKLWSSLKNSWVEWYGADGKWLDNAPDWADEIDLWDLFYENAI